MGRAEIGEYFRILETGGAILVGDQRGRHIALLTDDDFHACHELLEAKKPVADSFDLRETLRGSEENSLSFTMTTEHVFTKCLLSLIIVIDVEPILCHAL